MNIIEENSIIINKILDRRTVESEKVLELCHRLAETTDRLDAIYKQAMAVDSYDEERTLLEDLVKQAQGN